ncbi:lysozyme inhibitor LprI family protein [Aliikangiella coralliicola]|uniref:DUF1311 domain-containing protein n=1 Tax=Aliikangiella coralliicola TaxID=2592383 RepID=A0A545UFN7_9GAMM|nr:lysozyme inhibitor LprI family protein [Aliikangiella coralliicola]TQV88284.1 DUF1311 domain-containing protein [Aliikangiella coralliicola]
MKGIIYFTILLISPFASADTGNETCKMGALKATLECLAKKLEAAKDDLNSVLEMIQRERAEDKLFIRGFNNAQNKWKESLKSDCDSIYDLWRYGSVKNVKWMQCKIELTKQRIYFINKYYVTEAEGI